MPNKLTYKEVEKEFSKRGLKLLDKEYDRIIEVIDRYKNK